MTHSIDNNTVVPGVTEIAVPGLYPRAYERPGLLDWLTRP